MRTIMPREFYIPKGSKPVADPQSSAVAYVYRKPDGKPAVALFAGKGAKPIAQWRCRSDAELERTVTEFFAGQRARMTSKAEHAARRLAPNTLKMGDILNTCWGYDQTNVEFFEVVAVAGQYVTVQEVAQASEDTGWLTGRCVPQSGKFTGKPMRKLVQYGDHVTIDDVRTARKWNTATVAGVAVGPARSWSAYA